MRSPGPQVQRHSLLQRKDRPGFVSPGFNTNGAAPENPAQDLRVVNSEVCFCCCWSQKALKMGIINVYFFFFLTRLWKRTRILNVKM